MIPQSWHRAENPIKPGKKKLRNPPIWVGPQKYDKTPEKYTKNGQSMTRFVLFFSFFRIFGARPGGISFFFRTFFVFPGLRGFPALCQDRDITKEIPFFSCGMAPFRPLPKAKSPATCLSSTKKSSSEVPARGGLGKAIACGGGGWTESKKDKKTPKDREPRIRRRPAMI